VRFVCVLEKGEGQERWTEIKGMERERKSEKGYIEKE
jgi:hypothetical protein